MTKYDEATRILEHRFHCDSLISIATVEDGRPHVRTVNAFYEDGAFYTVTYALSNKMRQIARCPEVAVCGEWFTGHGVGENLGHVLAADNADMMDKLRVVFAEWYDNGHTDESDPHTCILRVRLTDGVLMSEGTRFDLDFDKQKA